MHLIDDMDMLVLINMKNELLVVNISENRLVKKMDMEGINPCIIVSRHHPLCIIYSIEGYVRIVHVINGEELFQIGPFLDIAVCYLDEEAGCLSVYSHKQELSMFIIPWRRLSSTQSPPISPQVESPEYYYPLTHPPTHPPTLPVSVPSRGLLSALREYMEDPDGHNLSLLEDMGERSKLSTHPSPMCADMFILKKISEIKYANGVRNIDYNLVMDGFSLQEVLPPRQDILVSCAVLGRGKRLFAVAVKGRGVVVYSLSTGQVLHTFDESSPKEVVDLLLSSKENLLVRATKDGEISSWELGEGIPKQRLLCGEDIKKISLSDDDKWIGIVSKNRRVEVFGLTGSKGGVLVQNNPEMLLFLPEGKAVLITSGSSFEMLTVPALQRLGTVHGHTAQILKAVNLSPHYLLTVAHDKTLRLWDWKHDFVCTRTFPIIKETPLSFDISADMRLLLTAEQWSTLRIYDLTTDKAVWEYDVYYPVKLVKWISPSAILVQTTANVKVIHLILNFTLT